MDANHSAGAAPAQHHHSPPRDAAPPRNGVTPLDPWSSKTAPDEHGNPFKIVLRLLAVIVPLIGLGFAAVAYQRIPTGRNVKIMTLETPCSATLLPLMFLLALSAAWNLAELITRAIRQTSGFHPGAHIAGNLFLSCFLLLISAETLWMYHKVCSASTDKKKRFAYTASWCGIAESLLSFILFLIACFDLKRRRKQHRADIEASQQRLLEAVRP